MTSHMHDMIAEVNGHTVTIVYMVFDYNVLHLQYSTCLYSRQGRRTQWHQEGKLFI